MLMLFRAVTDLFLESGLIRGERGLDPNTYAPV